LSSGTGSRESGVTFLSGAFHVRFEDERATRAAARDAVGGGFAVEIRAEGASGWLVVCQRRQSFPADDQSRYAGRLRTIAAAHGGAYERFIPE
jgi:hypothetical protein